MKNKFMRIFLQGAVILFLVFFLSFLTGEKFSFPSGKILDLRLLRVLTGLVCGIALAQAGVVYQMVFSNPLADPYLLGSSSGASLGVAILIVLNIKTPFIFPFIAGLGAFLSVILVLKICEKIFSKNTLILVGVALNFFFSAIVILIVSLKNRQAFTILYFMMGDLSQTNKISLAIVSVLVLLLNFLIFRKARILNGISFGSDISANLGIDFKKEAKKLLIFSSLLTGCAVAVSGTIGFIGLMSPHIARKITGSDARFLLPAAGITGACLLVLSDMFARRILYPTEIPVGVITAILGAPFFLFLFLKNDRN